MPYLTPKDAFTKRHIGNDKTIPKITHSFGVNHPETNSNAMEPSL